MFRHIVLLRFKPEATTEQRQALLDALRALPSQIPQVREYNTGFDLGLRDKAFDLALFAGFDDEPSWRAYLTHPAHVAVLEDLIAPAVEERVSVQFLTD